jgi:hypothetical protein
MKECIVRHDIQSIHGVFEFPYVFTHFLPAESVHVPYKSINTFDSDTELIFSPCASIIFWLTCLMLCHYAMLLFITYFFLISNPALSEINIAIPTFF